MPFLDVNIKSENAQFVSDVYTKSTSDGKLLNARSECPDRYKSSVIAGPIRRAYIRFVRLKIYSITKLRN